MNKIRQLLDEQFVLGLFRRELLGKYPDLGQINRVAIHPYKDQIWETTYHVVIGYDVFFLKSDGQEEIVPVVCSAHSSEPRENVFTALKYLWAQGFPAGEIDIPEPLFYSEEFRGTFYRALAGESLLYYIKKHDLDVVAEMVVSSARLLARLHSLPATTAANFNPDNSRIRTVMPGVGLILSEMNQRYAGRYDDDLRELYDGFMASEEQYFRQPSELLSLIHGDAHPENVIRTAPGRIGLIDFTDICLGDFTRDLGSFLQQLEYKVVNKLKDPGYAAELKDLFLQEYWQASARRWSPAIQERIDLYYNWTAVRSATYWFLKFEPDEQRAAELLAKIKSGVTMRLAEKSL